MFHSEAKFNQADAAHRAEAMKCMKGMAKCHATMLGIHGELEDLHDDFSDRMREMRKHFKKAMLHLNALSKPRPKPGDDDGGSTDDGGDDEPAAIDDIVVDDPPWSPRATARRLIHKQMAQRRERMREAAALVREARAIAARGKEIDAIVASMFPAVPTTWKVIDPRRQVTACLSDERYLSGAERVWVNGGDFADYKKIGGAVTIDHDRNRTIAWGLELKIDGPRLIGTAQFPPEGVWPPSDRIFARIQRGEIECASLGYSVIEQGISDGEVRVERWTLCEWSFCARGQNPGARVLSVGSAGSKRGRWDDPRAPHRPEYLECGGTDAHFAAALRRMPGLLAAAAWR
jgi:hypothetical protein